MTVCREVQIVEYKTKLAGIHNTISSFDSLASGNELLNGVKRSLVFSRVELALALILLILTIFEYKREKRQTLSYAWERTAQSNTVQKNNGENIKQPLEENDDSYLPPRTEQFYDHPADDECFDNQTYDETPVPNSNSSDCLNVYNERPAAATSIVENTYESPPDVVNEWPSPPADSTYDS